MHRHGPLVKYFKGVYYFDAAAAVKHVLDLYVQFRPIHARPAVSPSTFPKRFAPVEMPIVNNLLPFDRAVLECAADHFNGVEYAQRAILQELPAKVMPVRQRNLKVFLNTALTRLRRLKLVEPLPKAVVQKKVGEGEVEGKMHVARQVIFSGHSLLPRDWTQYINFSEAEPIAMKALKDAIMCHGGQSDFELQAAARIASALSAQARHKKLQATQVSLPSELQEEIELLLKTHLKPRHVAVFGLRRLGIRNRELATFFKCTPSAVSVAYSKAKAHIIKNSNSPP